MSTYPFQDNEVREEINEAELASFWGADLAELTKSQRMLIYKLFKAVKKRAQSELLRPAHLVEDQSRAT